MIRVEVVAIWKIAVRFGTVRIELLGPGTCALPSGIPMWLPIESSDRADRSRH